MTDEQLADIREWLQQASEPCGNDACIGYDAREVIVALLAECERLRGERRVRYEARDIIMELAAEVERLRGERRWSPVREGLPETDGGVLIALPYPIIGRPCTTGQYVNHTWYCDDFGGEAEVTHWMPLPEPPEVTP
jgi:hypothetical protein